MTTARRPRTREPILRLTGVSKAFGPVTVLRDVDLEIYPGEVHAVLGENGAGKSTLINLVTGKLTPTAGFISFGDGHQVRSPRDAAHHGIRLVPQDTTCVPAFSVGRNLLLGSERRFLRRDHLSRAERTTAREALARVGAEFTVETRAADLTVPQLRLMQIAKALSQPGDVLVLDEPTAALSSKDSSHLLDRVETLRASGAAIVYVTHRLAEVMRLADRVTVLRDGAKVASYLRESLTHDRLIQDMTRGLGSAPPDQGLGRAVAAPTPPVLSARSITRDGAVHDVGLDVAAGEIVGVAGVQGSGQGLLMALLAGRHRPDEGSITLDGHALRPGSPRAARRAGLALLPADRRRAGVITRMSLSDNVAQSAAASGGWSRRLGWRRRIHERRAARRLLATFNTRYADVTQDASSLSGGNQQKVALARAICTSPKVLLVDEPTQGVDIHAKQDVRAHLVRLARESGCAVVVATSEFEDLVGLADRIHVMRRGQLVATLGPDSAYEDILRHAVG